MDGRGEGTSGRERAANKEGQWEATEGVGEGRERGN